MLSEPCTVIESRLLPSCHCCMCCVYGICVFCAVRCCICRLQQQSELGACSWSRNLICFQYCTLWCRLSVSTSCLWSVTALQQWHGSEMQQRHGCWRQRRALQRLRCVCWLVAAPPHAFEWECHTMQQRHGCWRQKRALQRLRSACCLEVAILACCCSSLHAWEGDCHAYARATAAGGRGACCSLEVRLVSCCCSSACMRVAVSRLCSSGARCSPRGGSGVLLLFCAGVEVGGSRVCGMRVRGHITPT
jgi:hypothetical protein